MTNLITLTIPNDDHIALRAFGKALEEMALAHGAEPRKLNVNTCVQQLESKDDYRKWYEEAIEASNEAGYMCMSAADVIKNMAGYISTLENYGSAMYKKAEPYSIDTTAQQVESLATHIITSQEKDGDPVDLGNGNVSQGYRVEVEDLPTTDSTGTPWDERIHSTSKALNADGTWRLRRKPKDMDEAEWAAFVETVKSELYTQTPVMTDEEVKALEPVETVEPTSEEIDEWEKSKQPDYLPEPPVTPPGDDFHTDEQTVAGIPPLPVPPPVVVAPPVPEVTTWDFPRLMTFLTERHGKIDVATVNTLLAQDGLASLQELNAHPDKIGPFVARVKAHLGE